jgi:hypothetical protein
MIPFSLTVFFGSVWILFWLSRGAFFVPMPRSDVPRVIRLLALHEGDAARGSLSGEKAVDVGSGDGRLLIALAEAGAEAHGFEHNILLVWRSRRAIRKAGLSGKAFVHWSNFWKEDFSSFTAVTIYGIPYIMRRLERKLRAELRSGARVVSYSFTFPNWQLAQSDNRVYLYRQS